MSQQPLRMNLSINDLHNIIKFADHSLIFSESIDRAHGLPDIINIRATVSTIQAKCLAMLQQFEEHQKNAEKETAESTAKG